MNFKKLSHLSVVTLFFSMYSCKTLETGGKIVDKDKGEVVISSAGDQKSALPEGRKDTSLTQAREGLEQTIKENPKDIKSLLSLSQLQLAQDRFSDAEETSRRVLLLDIKNQEARKVLAQVAIRRENYDMALIFLTSLGGEQSRDSSVHNMLGLIALSRGDNGEAMRLWKQALSINSGDISVRMNMGVMYLKNRLFSQASTQFERILKAAPNHQDAKLHLAIIEASRGKNVEAIETYKVILAQDKDNPLALFNMAVAQKNIKQYDDSVETLKKFIRTSSTKTKQTDHAFAMIDDINAIKASQGEKVSDSELQSLAQELSTKKKTENRDLSEKKASPKRPSDKDSTNSTAKSGPSQTSKGSNQNMVNKPNSETDPSNAVESTPNQNVTDSEIEALERQLKAPAH